MRASWLTAEGLRAGYLEGVVSPFGAVARHSLRASGGMAVTVLAKARQRDAAGKVRRRVAAELICDLERAYQRKKAANKELNALLAETGSTLTSLHGIGPSGAAGKTPMEAMRALKRRLSDIVYRQIVLDHRAAQRGPGGHVGTATGSSAAGLHPSTGTSEKSLPGPASDDLTPGKPAHSPDRSRPSPSAPDRRRRLLDRGDDRGTLSRPERMMA